MEDSQGLERVAFISQHSLNFSGSLRTRWREGLEERADAAPSVFDGPLGGFAHSVFELGEDLLDRVEIGAVGRQEEHPRADSADHETDGGPLVRAEIVEHDDVAFFQGWDENLLDIGGEALAIDGAVDHERRVEPIAAQR